MNLWSSLFRNRFAQEAVQRTIYWVDLTGGRLCSPAYADDAGLDLYVSQDTEILPRVVMLGSTGPNGKPELLMRKPTDVPCGIRVAMPPSVAALVVGRSSSVKRGLTVHLTLIDPGYRGDLFVFVSNDTEEPITLERGTRVAQLMPVPSLASALHLARVGSVDDLPPSDRGARGFGSSGGTR